MPCNQVSIFSGISRTDLQAHLTAIQTAYLELSSGKQVATATYAQGDGNRSVTYRATDIGALTMLIKQLQQELGIITRARRPLRFNY